MKLFLMCEQFKKTSFEKIGNCFIPFNFIFAGIFFVALSSGFSQGVSPRIQSMYTDKKGHRLDDVITVMVIERSSATNDSKTKTDEKQGTAVGFNKGTGTLDFLPNLGAGMHANQSFDGSGQTSRAGEVKATVSSRIIRVLDNGNLYLEGHKEVEVNDEKEILKVSGIVRPEDINSDNTIFSSKLADARIQYTGNGDNSKASKMGWWSRFWHWVL